MREPGQITLGLCSNDHKGQLDRRRYMKWKKHGLVDFISFRRGRWGRPPRANLNLNEDRLMCEETMHLSKNERLEMEFDLSDNTLCLKRNETEVTTITVERMRVKYMFPFLQLKGNGTSVEFYV